ncbi:MAG: SoxR reducing system RseC family protein [Gallionellaceae bacterium]|jgi:sigma-E factor negative regulatory protein RseC|nr:SoxR reducing system RseC family protein [Gallionellaceae bacterium]
MNTHDFTTTDYAAPGLTEGIAQVVALDGRGIWLVPEQTGSCGSCAASSMCSAKGIGTVANRLEARRFRLDENPAELIVGERVVIGVRENALVRASLTAYAIPLVTLLLAGALAQWRYGSDLVTMAAAVGGLLFGLAVARIGADKLLARGDLLPQYIRRARPGETCNSK